MAPPQPAPAKRPGPGRPPKAKVAAALADGARSVAAPYVPAAVAAYHPGEGVDGAAYRRKDKSLGLLCDNFLRFCREQRDGVVSLDAAAVALGVERRRIYDVTNILEALDVVSRRTKNAYTWHGTAYLPRTLKKMLDSALVDAGRGGEAMSELWWEEAGRAALAGRPGSNSRQHWFFGRLTRVMAASDAASVRARASESPADRNPLFSGCSYTVGEEGEEEGGLALGIHLERPVFPDPLVSYLSVPPLWLEPVEAGAGGAGRKGGKSAPTAAADAAAAVATAAFSACASRVPGGASVLRALCGARGSGFSSLPQPPATVSVSVTVNEAASSIGVLPASFTASLTRPLPPPLSILVTPLGDSWATSGPGRGPGAEPTVGLGGEVECVLEEEPLTHRLRSMPLLSEVLYPVAAMGAEAALAWAAAALGGAGRGAAPALAPLKRSRRDRSLGILTQRFIKLFLLDRKVVTLDFAGPIVIPEEDSEDEEEEEEEEGNGHRKGAGAKGKASAPAPASLVAAVPGAGTSGMSDSNKLKVRRLYDIANVLCSLRLIDRVFIKGKGTKKPAFRWRGPAYVEPVGGVPLPDWALLKSAPHPDHISRSGALAPAPAPAAPYGSSEQPFSWNGAGSKRTSSAFERAEPAAGAEEEAWGTAQPSEPAHKRPTLAKPVAKAKPAGKGRPGRPPAVKPAAAAVHPEWDEVAISEGPSARMPIISKPLLSWPAVGDEERGLPSRRAAASSALSPPPGLGVDAPFPDDSSPTEVGGLGDRLGQGRGAGGHDGGRRAGRSQSLSARWGSGLGLGCEFTPMGVGMGASPDDGTASAGPGLPSAAMFSTSFLPSLGFRSSLTGLAGRGPILGPQSVAPPMSMAAGLGLALRAPGAGEGSAGSTFGAARRRIEDGSLSAEGGEGDLVEAGESDGLGRPKAGKRRRRLVPGEVDLPRPNADFIEMGMGGGGGGGERHATTAVAPTPGGGSVQSPGEGGPAPFYYFSPGIGLIAGPSDVSAGEPTASVARLDRTSNPGILDSITPSSCILGSGLRGSDGAGRGEGGPTPAPTAPLPLDTSVAMLLGQSTVSTIRLGCRGAFTGTPASTVGLLMPAGASVPPPREGSGGMMEDSVHTGKTGKELRFASSTAEPVMSVQ